MAHSFSVVEEKLGEADFFLDHFGNAGRHTIGNRYYFSAFVSAARSVTFALQFSMSGVRGFEEWYAKAQATLRADLLAPHFVEIRNDIQKKGLNPLNRVPMSHIRQFLWQQLREGSRTPVLVLPLGGTDSEARLTDAVEASKSYFRLIVSLVFDTYVEFKTVVDPRWYYTQANFEASGRTIEDALLEMGLPSGWMACASGVESDAWRALRAQHPRCALNELFDRQLGKIIADPDEIA